VAEPACYPGRGLAYSAPVATRPYSPGPFLTTLSGQDLEALTAAARPQSFRRGAYLLREGERPGLVLFVLAGMIKLTKDAASGREVVLEMRVPGDVVGELGAIDLRPRSANAVAISEVQVLVIASEPFRRIVAERVGVANAVLMTVVHRLRRAADRQLELGTSDPLGRVCARLVELAAAHGVDGASGTRIDVGITQHDLADWCGISRDGVIRALRDLRARGLIETGRRSIVLRDVTALCQQGIPAD